MLQKIIMKISFGFVLLLSFILSSCQEETINPELSGSINGTVISADSTKPVPGANISTTPPSVSVITDSNGKFTIPGLPVGDYSIIVKKPGYKQIMANVSVKESNSTEASIIMEKDLNSAKPPLVPANPLPLNQAKDQSTTVLLKWSSAKQNSGLPVKYDITVYESNSTSTLKTVKDCSDTTLTVESLRFSTTYYWQITAKDSFNTIKGDVWSFTTREMPQNPILFSTNRDGNYEIYSTDSTIANTIRLTNNIARDLYPRYSPDRTKIAFISDRNNQHQIFLMNPDGTNVTRLTSISIAGYNNDGTGLCWSPDSKQLLFCHYNTLYRINADGTNLTALATAPADRHFRECDWSLKGDKIVVLTQGVNPYDNEIYIMNSNGSNAKVVVDNLPGIVESPSFSKDGNSILYTHDVSGFETAEGKQLDTHIFKMNLSTLQNIDLSIKKTDGTNDLHPKFTVDGGRVIFENKYADDFSRSDLWIVDMTGLYRNKVVQDGVMPDWR